MRKLLCFVAVAALVPLTMGVYAALDSLPMDATPIVREKYIGFAGVIKLWIYDGFSSAAAYVNSRIADFERGNPGARVAPIYVPLTAIENYAQSGINAPDVIIMPMSSGAGARVWLKNPRGSALTGVAANLALTEQADAFKLAACEALMRIFTNYEARV